MSAIDMLVAFGKKERLLSQEKYVYVPEVMALNRQISTEVYREVIRLGGHPTA